MTSQSTQISMGNTWELSLYELHRKPHEMVSDNTAIAVSPRSLHSELMCPICLDLMRNTQTTKECLHRFCQECIITALRSGNKECPTCRKKLVSKRSLRPDPNFDKLIAKIYYNREELNAQQEKQVNRRAQPIQRRKRNAETLAEQEQHKRMRMEANEDEDDDDLVTPPSSEVGAENVEIQIRPHPHHPALRDTTTKNLVTTSLCTVEHLLHFLHLNSCLDEKEGGGSGSYKLHAQVGDEFKALSSCTTLQQISKVYWTAGEKLKLFFTLDLKDV